MSGMLHRTVVLFNSDLILKHIPSEHTIHVHDVQYSGVEEQESHVQSCITNEAYWMKLMNLNHYPLFHFISFYFNFRYAQSSYHFDVLEFTLWYADV